MGLRLVDDDLDLSLELTLPPGARSAVSIQLQRTIFGSSSFFGERLAEQLTELLDSDLQPPSRAQLSYAIAISRALDVSLPGEAIKFRGSMFDFLRSYAPVYKARVDRANLKSTKIQDVPRETGARQCEPNEE